jgi:hypothetical protein
MKQAINLLEIIGIGDCDKPSRKAESEEEAYVRNGAWLKPYAKSRNK